MRNLSVTRATSATMRENQPVRWTPYSHLPSLRDTREEVLAIARVLGPTLAVTFFGPPGVPGHGAPARSRSRKIVAFATHGLLPGDFLGIEQPALALAAPPGGDADANPRLAMLTLDDVLSLKLDADLVVLSA